jgi:hypothetical protein
MVLIPDCVLQLVAGVLLIAQTDIPLTNKQLQAVLSFSNV